MSSTANRLKKSDNALDQMVNREEILQICYWYQGEGFGKIYNAPALGPFLSQDTKVIDYAMKELATEGYLKHVAEPHAGYKFTSKGKKLGGRLFADSFAEYQKQGQGHGECPDGCCDDDDHSQCGDACSLH